MSQLHHLAADSAPSAPTISHDPAVMARTVLETMTALQDIMTRETELVRAGNVRDAIALEQDKAALSRRYMMMIEQLKVRGPALEAAAPELLAAMREQHEAFRAMLQVNLSVLATAHAVSEGIVRGVNTEMQRKHTPQAYTASGQRAAPSAQQMSPLAISRSL